MYKIETDYIWVILKEVDPTFFKIVTNFLENFGDFKEPQKFGDFTKSKNSFEDVLNLLKTKKIKG